MTSETPAAGPDAEIGTAARLARVLALAGGVVMVALGLLVTTSVLLRRFAGEGVNGDFELVQTGLAVAVFTFLPLCQAHRGNVMVDTFTLRMPGKAQAGLDALWDLVYAAFAAFIAWRLAIGASEARDSHTTSMVLELPLHWAIAACAAIAAFLAVVGAMTAVRRLEAAS